MTTKILSSNKSTSNDLRDSINNKTAEHAENPYALAMQLLASAELPENQQYGAPSLPISTQNLLLIRSSLLTEKLTQLYYKQSEYKEIQSQLNYMRRESQLEGSTELTQRKQKVQEQISQLSTDVRKANLKLLAIVRAIEIAKELGNTDNLQNLQNSLKTIENCAANNENHSQQGNPKNN